RGRSGEPAGDGVAAELRRAGRRVDRAVLAAAPVILLALYATTAPRSVVPNGVDSAKFGYMARILGVPHAPGYPLYLLIGWLFSWLPIGTLAFRMNLLSACFGAITAALVGAICLELGAAPAFAALAAVLLGAGRVFWSQAIMPELYTLHTALGAAVGLALLRWQHTRKRSWLTVAATCFGLDMAHHTDISLFVPAVIAFIVATEPTVFGSVPTLLRALAAAIAPLVLYGYVIVRTREGAEYVEAGARTLGELALVIGGRQHTERLFTGTQAIRSQIMWFGRLLAAELGIIGCVLALVGIGVLWRRNRAMGLFI